MIFSFWYRTLDARYLMLNGRCFMTHGLWPQPTQGRGPETASLMSIKPCAMKHQALSIKYNIKYQVSNIKNTKNKYFIISRDFIQIMVQKFTSVLSPNNPICKLKHVWPDRYRSFSGPRLLPKNKKWQLLISFVSEALRSNTNVIITWFWEAWNSCKRR